MARMRTVVVVPTYQEAGNITRFLSAVRAAAPDTDVLVVDDNSADGTGELAEQAAAELGPGQGAPPSGQAGARHRLPGRLPARPRRGLRRRRAHGRRLLARPGRDPGAAPPDRLRRRRRRSAPGTCPGGSTPNWPLHRRLLSRWGNRYTATVLRLPLTDVTSGFRAVRSDVLRAADTGHGARRGLRLPHGAGPPVRAQRRPGGGGPDRLPRPRAGRVEDVGADHRRVDDARDRRGRCKDLGRLRAAGGPASTRRRLGRSRRRGWRVGQPGEADEQRPSHWASRSAVSFVQWKPSGRRARLSSPPGRSCM